MKLAQCLCLASLCCASVNGLVLRSHSVLSQSNASGNASGNASNATNATEPRTPEETNMQDMIVAEAEDEFKMMDTDGNGCVSYQEFSAPYVDSFHAGVGSGGVRSEEMKKMDEEMEEEMVEALKEHFEDVDEDDDKCISKKELEGGVETYLDDCEAQFHAIDHTGDDRISKNEVYEYAAEGISEQEISQEQVEEIFNSYDADKSGFVNEEEFCGCSGIGGGGNATNATDAKDEKKKEEKKEFLLTAIPKRARARLLKRISFARKAGVRISKACRIQK